MKFLTLTRKAMALMISSGLMLALLCGCSPDNPSVASPSDGVPSQAEESAVPVRPSEAVSVTVGGEKTDEVFLLQYNWYGEEFTAEDSLNKMMIDSYSPEGKHAPYCKNHSDISFVFGSPEGAPSIIMLTQYANTFKANSGIPFDTVDIQLEPDESGALAFTVDFRNFRMFYYLLECEWENGNSAKYAFATEKTK